MDDPRWLRFITIGLVLAALAVGYFLFSGRLSPNQNTITQSSPVPTVLGQDVQASPDSTAAGSPSPTPTSAYSALVNRSQGVEGNKTLPKTGFPLGLAAVFSISALISGWGLRKFPH
ncbi:hypothetical protein HYU95_01990 [Candidatus Daviesbacteria bacterium]|nr:hypothetical protein [Candidatus Daviesbacteria bacterium]